MVSLPVPKAQGGFSIMANCEALGFPWDPFRSKTRSFLNKPQQERPIRSNTRDAGPCFGVAERGAQLGCSMPGCVR